MPDKLFDMSSSSVKREMDKDLTDKDNMASPTVPDRDNDGAEMTVPPGIKLLFSNLSDHSQSSNDKLSKRLNSLERDLQGKIKELVSVAIKEELDKLRNDVAQSSGKITTHKKIRKTTFIASSGILVIC